MKKDYILKSSISLLFLFSSALLAAGCDKGDKHNYKEEWDVSPTEHWHACLDEGCNEEKDRATHTFTWVTKTEAGIHANKVEEGTCSVCSYKTERVIEGTYTHEIDMENWAKDETGHYHVSKCDSKTPHNHEPIKKDFAAHTFGEWVTKSEASLDTDKVEHRLCRVCNYEETRTIENSATHTWKINYDLDKHWEETTCNHETPLKKNEAEHTFKFVIVDGSTHKQVSTCSIHEQVEKAAVPHTYDNDEDTTCNDCGYVRDVSGLAFIHAIAPRTYNGQPQGITSANYTLGLAFNGPIEIRYKEASAGDETYVTTAPTDVGTYKVALYCTGNLNYAPGKITETAFVIEPYKVAIKSEYYFPFDAALANDTSITYKELDTCTVTDLGDPITLILRANKPEYKSFGRKNNVPVTDLVFDNPNFVPTVKDNKVTILNYDDLSPEIYVKSSNVYSFSTVWSSGHTGNAYRVDMKNGTLKPNDYLINSRLEFPLEILGPTNYPTKGETPDLRFRINNPINSEEELKAKLNNTTLTKVKVEKLKTFTDVSDYTTYMNLGVNQSRYLAVTVTIPKGKTYNLKIYTWGSLGFNDTSTEKAFSVFKNNLNTKLQYASSGDNRTFLLTNTNQFEDQVPLIIKITKLQNEHGLAHHQLELQEVTSS